MTATAVWRALVVTDPDNPTTSIKNVDVAKFSNNLRLNLLS